MADEFLGFLNDTFNDSFWYFAEDDYYWFYKNAMRYAQVDKETGMLSLCEDGDFYFVEDEYLSKWTRKMVQH